MSRPATLAVGAAAAIGAAYRVSMSPRSQLFGEFPSQSNAGTRRAVALTFDDGPNEPYTTRLLDLLAERDVRASFFHVGRAVERHPEVVAAVAAAGHTVGNHSYHHQWHRCFSRALIEDDVRRAQDAIANAAGVHSRLYRPPWLARSPATFGVLREHGLLPVSGRFCHPLEVAQIDPSRIAGHAVARVRPGQMIIFHDGYNGRGADRTHTLDAVARTIDALGETGWDFATVDELLGVEPYLDVDAT